MAKTPRKPARKAPLSSAIEPSIPHKYVELLEGRLIRPLEYDKDDEHIRFSPPGSSMGSPTTLPVTEEFKTELRSIAKDAHRWLQRERRIYHLSSLGTAFFGPAGIIGTALLVASGAAAAGVVIGLTGLAAAWISRRAADRLRGPEAGFRRTKVRRRLDRVGAIAHQTGIKIDDLKGIRFETKDFSRAEKSFQAHDQKSERQRFLVNAGLSTLTIAGVAIPGIVAINSASQPSGVLPDVVPQAPQVPGETPPQQSTPQQSTPPGVAPQAPTPGSSAGSGEVRSAIRTVLEAERVRANVAQQAAVLFERGDYKQLSDLLATRTVASENTPKLNALIAYAGDRAGDHDSVCTGAWAASLNRSAHPQAADRLNEACSNRAPSGTVQIGPDNNLVLSLR